jgi:hypothetical protein
VDSGGQDIEPGTVIDPGAIFETVELRFGAQILHDLDRQPRRLLYPSKFAQLNRAAGGYRSGSISVLVAPTGAGKSSAALNEVDHYLASGTPVILFSSELGADEVAAKLVTIRRGRKLEEDKGGGKSIFAGHWKPSAILEGQDGLRPAQAAEYLMGGPSAVAVEGIGEVAPFAIVSYADDDPPGDVVKHIETAIEAFKRRTQQSPIVVIDYLQDLTEANPEKEGSARASVGAICKGLRKLAKRMNVAMLLISSTARANYGNGKKKPSSNPLDYLGTGKESGSIEYDASLTLYLVVEPPADPPQEWKNAVLMLPKARHGVATKIGLRFHGASGLMVEAPEAIDAIFGCAGGHEEVTEAIAAIEGRTGGQPASVKEISEETGIAEPVVRGICEQLVAKGLLKPSERKTKKGGRPPKVYASVSKDPS